MERPREKHETLDFSVKLSVWNSVSETKAYFEKQAGGGGGGGEGGEGGWGRSR